MYERQRQCVDIVQELMMEEESAMPVSFSNNSDNMMLTPTTLARFQTELNNTIVIAPQSNLSRGEYSGNRFQQGGSRSGVPVGFDDDDDDEYDDDDDDSSIDSNSQFSAPVSNNNKLMKSAQRPLSKSQSVKVGMEQKQRKLPGPRPSRTLEEMTPLEAERRRRRRERNKNAAAKCRQKRVEQTNELLAETEELERESNRLEREIENLRRTKNQLEFVLDAHKPACTAVFTDIKFSDPLSTFSSASNVYTVRPNNLPISSMPATCRSSMMSTSSLLDGPIFSFDMGGTPAGLTPMLMAGELNSPSSFILLSPSTLTAQ